jgi:large subunit ribosomal protein L15
MQINDVHQGITKRKARRRIGRGPGSGLGKTAGKGDKGHSSRQGFSYRLGFEGGQMSLVRRVAKRGFNNNFFATKVIGINLYTLERVFESGATVDLEALKAKGLTNGKFDAVKILGTGELTKTLVVKAHEFSASAVEKITKAGGSVERISR